MEQKSIFLETQGDDWFRRNSGGSDDSSELILKALKYLEYTPTSVLDVGCCIGKVLAAIQNEYTAQCHGIEPSSEAVSKGTNLYPKLMLKKGSADKLPYDNASFDLIIYGGCLCLCDRNDLFKVAYEADRCLKEGGLLIITDFEPNHPRKNPWKHHKDIFCYKMKYPDMFLWNPAYCLLYKKFFTLYGQKKIDDPNERFSISVIKKLDKYAYPEMINFT